MFLLTNIVNRTKATIENAESDKTRLDAFIEI